MGEFQLLWQVKMKMSKYFMCCDECFSNIAKKNSKAAKAWMDMCTLYLEKGNIFRILECPAIQILEHLRFIVSVDEEDCIAIKVQGHMLTEEGEHFFCSQEGHHD